MKIINLDKHEMLDPACFGQESNLEAIANSSDGVMTALAVLCSDGNGRGGGDLHSTKPIIGSWAGDRVALVGEGVRVPALSAPGLEDVPLLEQFEPSARDVSQEVIAAIIDGEGKWTDLGGLPLDVSRRAAYRGFFGERMNLLVPDEKGAYRPIPRLADLLGLFGTSAQETRKRTVRKLEEGINRLAELVDEPVRWTVESFRFDASPSKVDALHLKLRDNDGASNDLAWRFGEDSLAITAPEVLDDLRLSRVLDAWKPDVACFQSAGAGHPAGNAARG